MKSVMPDGISHKVVTKVVDVIHQINEIKKDDTGSNAFYKKRTSVKENILMTISSFKVPMKEEQLDKDLNRPMHPTIYKVPLAHSLTGPQSGVLLVTKDYPRVGTKRKPVNYKISNDHFVDMLKMAGCNHLVSEVMSITQLKGDYSELESLEALEKRTDMVLCDSSLVKVLPRVLGGTFNGAGKHPVALKLRPTYLNEEITKTLAYGLHKWSFRNPRSTMIMGHTDLSKTQLVENVISCLNHLASEKFPGGWDNVASVYLSVGGLPVPLYISQGNGMKVPSLLIEKEEVEVFDDDIGLGDVRITASGDIIDGGELIEFTDDSMPMPKSQKKRKRPAEKAAKKKSKSSLPMASSLPMMNVEEGIDYVV